MLEDRIVLWNTYVSLGDATARWATTALTFSYSNFLDGWLRDDGLTTDDITHSVEDAMGVWTGVTPLQFTQVADSGPGVNDNLYDATNHPNIRFGHHFIDGNSGLNVLAHSWRPGTNGRNGDVHFDDGNTWDFDSLMETAVHEFGHAIGMAHANGDVVNGMAPAAVPAIMDALAGSYAFNGEDSAFLFQDDINGLRSLYGNGLGYVLGIGGDLNVYGTGATPAGTPAAQARTGNDVITVSTSGGNITVSSEGNGSFTRSLAGIASIHIHGQGGTDILRVESNGGLPTFLYGDDGDDIFDFGFGNRDLGRITGETRVVGGAGNDRVFLYDNANGASTTYWINSFLVDRPGFGGIVLHQDAASQITLWAGLGVDTVNVLSTQVGTPVFINNAGGRDTVNIGHASLGVETILADVQVQNDPSYTTLNIDDTGSNVFHDATIDRNGNFGYVSGLAPARIFWDIADIDAINLTTGSGWDKIYVLNNTETLNLDSAEGLETVRLGRNGNMQEITGTVTIRNRAANTIIHADDSNDTLARSVGISSFTGWDGTVYDSIAGLAPAPIIYRTSQTLYMEMLTGAAADTVTVTGISGSTVIVGRGADTVSVGLPGSTLAGIQGSLGISNPTGATALVLNVAGETAAGAITTESHVTGLSPYPIGFVTADLRQLSIYAGSGGNTIDVENTPANAHGVSTLISSGAGSNVVNVKATSGALEVTGAGGFDIVHVGRSGKLDGIAGAVHVTNAQGRTILGLHDDADTVGRTATLDLGRLTWANYAAGVTWTPTTTVSGGVTYVGIDLGSGSDTLIANQTDALYSYVYLQTGAGNDQVQIRRTTGAIYVVNQGGVDTHKIGGPGISSAGIRGLVYSAGVAGSLNNLIVDGSGTPAGLAMSLGASTSDTSVLSGFAPAPIYYVDGNTRSLAIKTGAGADTLTLSGLRPGIAYSFDGGSGADRIVAENGSNRWNLSGAGAGSLVASFPTASPTYSYTLGFSNIEHLRGGGSDDTFKFSAGGGVSGTINGGTGVDKLDYTGRGSTVTVNFQTSTAPGIAGGFVGIESVAGSNLAGDTLIGPNTANTWTITASNAGKLNAITYAGFENLTGGTGRDVFKPGAGKGVTGTINGGAGVDWLDYAAYNTAMAVNLAAGTATNMKAILNIENVRAGTGGSTLTGNATGNILVGNIGVDTIRGGSGKSLLIGGKGSDSITGGTNQDIVTGDYTTLDANYAALEAILAEWKSGNTYEVRVNHLRSGGGLNGTFKLLYGTTVKDDAATDSLRGGSGRDWFLKSAAAVIADKAIDELVN